MSKKLVFTVGLLMSLIFTFAVTFSFATDGNGAMNGVNNAVNDVRGAVGGAENAVEGAVKDVTDNTKNATNNTENKMNDATRSNTTNLNVTGNNTQSTEYTANRTATTGTANAANNGNFLGMSSTMWTWLILAVAVVTIIALVWYYSNQLNNIRYDDND